MNKLTLSDCLLQDSLPESDSTIEDLTWIRWFCSLEGHEFLVEVPQNYFLQPSNLLNLEKQI